MHNTTGVTRRAETAYSTRTTEYIRWF